MVVFNVTLCITIGNDVCEYLLLWREEELTNIQHCHLAIINVTFIAIIIIASMPPTLALMPTIPYTHPNALIALSSSIKHHRL
jgi:hypothetical protein